MISLKPPLKPPFRHNGNEVTDICPPSQYLHLPAAPFPFEGAALVYGDHKKGRPKKEKK